MEKLHRKSALKMNTQASLQNYRSRLWRFIVIRFMHSWSQTKLVRVLQFILSPVIISLLQRLFMRGMLCENGIQKVEQ